MLWAWAVLGGLGLGQHLALSSAKLREGSFSPQEGETVQEDLRGTGSLITSTRCLRG